MAHPENSRHPLSPRSILVLVCWLPTLLWIQLSAVLKLCPHDGKAARTPLLSTCQYGSLQADILQLQYIQTHNFCVEGACFEQFA